MAFSYGTIKVWQDHDLTFTIEGAKKVPPKNFVSFLKMLGVFMEGGVPEPVAEAPAGEPPLREEGVCPECGSHKMAAKDDLRKCHSCEFVWRVPPVPPVTEIPS